MYLMPMRAETYSATEKIIGTWLAERGPAFRTQLILVTKCACLRAAQAMSSRCAVTSGHFAKPIFTPLYAKPNVVPALQAHAELARAYGLTPTQLALLHSADRTPSLPARSSAQLQSRNCAKTLKPLASALICRHSRQAKIFISGLPTRRRGRRTAEACRADDSCLGRLRRACA